MTTKLLTFLAVLFVLQGTVHAQNFSDLEKVSSNQVTDGVLKIPENHFSIQAPAGGFEWMVRKNNPSGTKTYVCVDRKTNEMFQLLLSQNLSEKMKLNDEYVNQLLQEFSLERVKKGYIVTKQGFMPSKIPIEGSYKTKMEVQTPGSNPVPLYWYQFLSFANKTLYVVQTASPLDTEPAFLKKAMSTFKISIVQAKSQSVLLTKPVEQKQQSPSEVQYLLERGDITGAIAHLIGFLLIPVMVIVMLVRKRTNRKETVERIDRVPSMMLSYYDFNGQVCARSFNKNMITIGSKSDCDLALTGLHPTHCRIYLSDRGYFAEDLGGGISINSVEGSGYLQGNDVIEIGGLPVRFSLNGSNS